MSEAQYWDGDASLCEAFRKADELKRNRKNEELWLQGLYIYEAIGRLTPVLHAFAKKGTKPEPYLAEPYPLNEKQAQLREEEEERQRYEQKMRQMTANMEAVNQKYKGE